MDAATSTMQALLENYTLSTDGVNTTGVTPVPYTMNDTPFTTHRAETRGQSPPRENPSEICPSVGDIMNMNDEDNNITGMIMLEPSANILSPIIMFAVGFMGNVIAIGCYECSGRRHQKIAFYGLIKGMFITNLAGYASVYPFMITAHLRGLIWWGGDMSCDFHGMSVLSFLLATAFLTGVLGFERFLAACKPSVYAKRLERRKVPYLITLIWLFAVFTAFLPIIGFGRMTLQYPNTWCFIDWRNDSTVGKLYTSILAAQLGGVMFVIFCLGLGATLFALNKCIIECKLKSSVVEIQRGDAVRALHVRRTKKRNNGAILWLTIQFDVIAILLMTCYVPVVLRITQNVHGMPLDNYATFKAMHMAEYYPAGIPWLYLLLHQQFWLRITRPYRDQSDDHLPEQVPTSEPNSPTANRQTTYSTANRPECASTLPTNDQSMSYMNNVKNNNASQNTLQYPAALHDGIVDVEAFREMLKRKQTRKDVNNFRHVQLDEITPLRWDGEFLSRDAEPYEQRTPQNSPTNNAFCPRHPPLTAKAHVHPQPRVHKVECDALMTIMDCNETTENNGVAENKMESTL
ncbi:prostaglandin E2 receptor EP3 subtype-like [Amphiura filiformis]|uniref:prostaglandin E2 receptor EP3 subtype-like n=1 Tax=Amphiura filiformis TaxID=82378 RepID=UPI003B2271FA